MEILQYTFFQNALISILLLSVVAAIIGTYIVTRRMVFIAGGITHTSFGGLGIGYYAGISPTLSALVFAVISTLCIERMSRNKSIREDSAIAVFWALGMAVGTFFIFMTPGYTPGLTEFLFGNILTITHTDIAIYALYTALLVLFFTLCYRPILYTTFDSDFAQVKGIKTALISTCMMLFVAIGVVLSIRLIGIMLLISILTIPQIIAEIFTSKFATIITTSGVICLVCNIAGLLISTFIPVPTGASIVMTLVALFCITKGGHMLYSYWHNMGNKRQYNKKP